ncbi:type IV toxin-antitoxin system AbiEi family antitoxin domain-containing protein [Enemella sp. A6]|uniref:type IV toxin-antitoxin system AbiEi family antitoxin domain-containing protein n=1 Tax=Enemella sp. A6 TaxID=3440152 RepID=UPI003EBFC723
MEFGVASTAQLLEQDWSRKQIRRAVDNGQLTRLRRGWFALPHADPHVARAVRCGGALSCASALQKQWVWVPHTSELHIRPSDAAPAVLPPGVRLCRGFTHQPAPKLAVDPLPFALEAALRCLSFEHSVVVLDSILHRDLLPVSDLIAVIKQLHGKHRDRSECRIRHRNHGAAALGGAGPAGHAAGADRTDRAGRPSGR